MRVLMFGWVRSRCFEELFNAAVGFVVGESQCVIAESLAYNNELPGGKSRIGIG